MKKHTAIIALAALVALATGCTREITFVHEPGSPIAFGASTGYEIGTADTRTEYSGELVGESPKYERIDWVAGTDRVRVLCEETSNDEKISDYKITTASNETGQQKSEATVEPVTGDGLTWGAPTADHYFYALYPAATQAGVTAAEAKLEIAAGHKATVTGRIPAEQTVTWDATTRTYKPDMKYAYMYAAAKVTPSTTDKVILPFKSLMTAFEFTLKAFTGDEIAANLTSVTITAAETEMAGGFTATLDENGLVEAVPADNAGPSVSADLGTGVRLSDQPVIITLFALPVNQDKLTLTLGFAGGLTRTLPLKNNGNWVSVEAGKKLYVNNIAVPNTFYYDMVSIPDITITGDSVLYDSDRTVTVNTEKDNSDGWDGTNRDGRKTAWKAYYVDGSKSRPSKGTVITGNSDYSATAPNWISITDGDSGDGLDDAFKFSILGTPVEGAGVKTGASASTDAMITKLQNNPLGTVDLSTRNFLSGGSYTTAETANCYVIDGYGTFLIPLVYGNAYKGGEYTNAYTWSAAAQSDTYLRSFVNADGNAINSPFILNDSNLSKQTPYNGCVVWQDTQKTFEILKDSAIEILSSKPAEGAINCAYLKFTIAQEDIKPGNLVIALRDATNKILWSWHIWIRANITPASGITGSDYAHTLHVNNVEMLNPNGSGTVTIGLLSEVLGWTPPVSYVGGTAPARNHWVAIVSTETQAVMGSFKISKSACEQADYNVNAQVYSAPYYQWGRKDPFLPTNGIAENKVFSSAEYTITAGKTTLVTESMAGPFPAMLANCIRNPHVFNVNESGVYTYSNLWDGDLILTEPNNYYSDRGPVNKTVYDPCPRGFTVPRTNFMTGATSNGWNSGTLYSKYYPTRSDANYNQEWPAGRRITSNHQESSNPDVDYVVFLPAIGWRGWEESSVKYEYSTDTYGRAGQMYYWKVGRFLLGNTRAGQSVHASGSSFSPLDGNPQTNGFPIFPQQE